MGDPRRPLPSLENPKWLTDIIVAFKDKPDVIQRYTNIYLDQVNRERAERLASLSAATAPTRAKIAAIALQHDKSETWKYSRGRLFEGPEGDDAYLPGDNKCNLFVYEMLALVGVQIPLITYETSKGLTERLRPPLAGEWANPGQDIPGFEVLQVPPDVPQPGDVAAIAKVSWNATGHVGIVVNSPDGSTPWTVSARADGVGHNDWGFRDENKGQVVFRRFVGPAK